MTDKLWAKLTGTKIVNRAAQRRRHVKERAAYIAVLGMDPEDKNNPYAATTGELKSWVKIEHKKGKLKYTTRRRNYSHKRRK